MGRVVIGLDKGYGDTTAFAYRLDSGREMEGLCLNKDGEKFSPPWSRVEMGPRF